MSDLDAAAHEPTPDAPANCGECRYWDHRRDTDGFCKRFAPASCSRENEVARWRQTHVEDWCGECERPAEANVAVRCEGCRFWFRPPNGIEPLFHGGRFTDWWRGAGVCRRYAPRTDAELGGRSFWRATHYDDTCGDGRALRARQSSTIAEIKRP